MGCSCSAVAGVDHRRRRPTRLTWSAAPLAGCRITTAVDAHRADGQRRCRAGSRPWTCSSPWPMTLMTSAESHLPAISKDDPGAGGVLEEQVDDRAAAQRRQLLDLAALHVVHVGGGVEERLDLVGGEVVDGEQVLHEMRHLVACRRPRPSRTLTRLGERARQVLADVVGPDRQLAVAAVDEHGEAYGRRAGRGRSGRRARPGWCDRRRARRRRARRPCRRCRRRASRSCARAGSAASGGRRGTSSRRARRPATGTPSTAAIFSAIRRASGTPRVGSPSSTRSVGALVALEDLVGDAGQGPGDVTGVEDGAARPVGAGFVGATLGGRHLRSGPPSPPHRTAR